MVGYQQKTFVQIRNSLQRRLRSTETSTGTFDLITAINAAINEAIHETVLAANFEWTIREFAFNTTPVVTSSTPLSDGVFIAAGSPVLTASYAGGPGGPFTLSHVGRFIRIDAGHVPYEILAYSNTNSVGLFTGFEGSTNKSNVPWRMLQNAYTLDPRVRAIRVMVIHDGVDWWPLDYVPPQEFDQINLDLTEERPQIYTVYRYTADGVARIKVWPIPAIRYVLRFAAYCFLPELVADGDILEVPGPAHGVIEAKAYERLCETVVHLDANERQTAALVAAEKLSQLIRDNMNHPDWDARRAAWSYISGLGPYKNMPFNVGRRIGWIGR